MKWLQYNGIIAYIMFLGLAYAIQNENGFFMMSFGILVIYHAICAIYLALISIKNSKKVGEENENNNTSHRKL